MGSGGSQSHALYETAPTVHEEAVSDLGPQADQIVDLLAEQTDGLGAPEGLNPSAAEHLEKFNELFDAIKLLEKGTFFYALANPLSGDEELAWYQALKDTSAKADYHLFQSYMNGLAHSDGEELSQLKAQATVAALAALGEGQLQKIAANEGFSYPELVGLNQEPGKNHALVHWLDPNYDSDIPSKKKIQAKAQERFTQLCAGQSVAGKTLADVDHTGYGIGAWSVTQEQYEALSATLAQQAEAFPSLPTAQRAGALAQLVDAENKLVTASVPGTDTASLSGSKAQATLKVDEALGCVAPYGPECALALEAAQKRGDITAEQCQVLSGIAALQMTRASVPASEKEDIAQVADTRIAQFAQAKTWHDTLAGSVSFTDEGKMAVLVTGASGPTDVVEMATAAQKYFAAKKDVSSWVLHTSDTAGLLKQISQIDVHGKPLAPDDLAKKFKDWAVGQDKATLLQAAEQLGMEGAASATKTQAKNYIAQSWGKGAGAPAPTSPGAKAAPTPKSAPTPSAALSAKTAPAVSKTGFGGQHATLMAALQHYSAAAVDVPQPLDAKVVAGHDFGAGQSAKGLGGVHSKSLHTGPDGGQWLFKPDKKTGGARAAAEAAASQVFHTAGVNAVPVYTARVGSHKGAVQPMVQGASPLSPDPAGWTQSDVDHLVRTHVAQWVMGDHDAHPGNFLKTASGGLVPIDAGQAFKHYGADTLSLDYHPNAVFGSPRPAHQQAYRAAAKGGLAPGVKIKPAVAHPVIKQIESIPDSQWRAMLHTTAHQGAKNPDIGWVPRMRARAAAQHKIPETKVSTAQVAEAFLSHACERKNTLRKTFTDFFTKELKLPGADVLTYGA
ncbi:hypothetical protein [Nocardiopsis sp. LOL_012]|uniref:hypothetical protein n=1 Tax=Nocardiopsis sp. LOL_012 TaxID=3345409 RepID=UPI003A86DF44